MKTLFPPIQACKPHDVPLECDIGILRGNTQSNDHRILVYEAFTHFGSAYALKRKAGFLE